MSEKQERQVIDLSAYPIDDKGHRIVPRQMILDQYKDLPDGTKSDDGAYIAYNGGLLKLLTPEDRAKGGVVRAEKREKRETFADAIKRTLYAKAPAKTCEALGLPLDSSALECIVATQSLLAADKAGKGSTKAAEFLRDTIGEKPVDRQEVSADIMTDAERSLIAKIQARLSGGDQAGEDT